MRYYVYENWRADGHKATLHQAACSFCNSGMGLAGGTRKDNGRWIDLGPHSSQNEAVAHAKRQIQAPAVKECKFCCR